MLSQLVQASFLSEYTEGVSVIHIVLCATHSSPFFSTGSPILMRILTVGLFDFSAPLLPWLLDHQPPSQFCLHHVKSPFFIPLHTLLCSQLSSFVSNPSPTLLKPVEKIKLLSMISLWQHLPPFADLHLLQDEGLCFDDCFKVHDIWIAAFTFNPSIPQQDPIRQPFYCIPS